MPRCDLVLLHAPSVYDFREKPILYGPVSDQIPSSPVFEMYPIGFTSLAEYLERAGYRVRIVNLAVRMLTDRNFDAEAMIAKLEAPVFGIDLHWMVHCHGSIEVARLVKKHHPQAKVLFGGFSASYWCRQLMGYPEIDYILRGDSTEEPLRQLIHCIQNKKEPEMVPNLVWRDSQNEIRENPFNHVPNDLSHVMQKHYVNTMRSVIRYRDLASYTPFAGWKDYPISAVFTCRGCTHNCTICGGSATTFRDSFSRPQPVFRSPEAVVRDIKQIARFSNGPAFVLGDLQQTKDDYTRELFRLLREKKIRNQLIFEVFEPAPKEFLQRLGQAAPDFCLEMSPESHDPEVRKAEGRHFTTEAMEQTFRDALDAGVSRIDIFFMMGIGKQTPQSALDTVEYCGHLLDRFGGDKRLFPFIAPLAPFLDPGSPAFENPEKHGYRVLFKTVEEHRQALVQPSWKYSLNYETEWMSREQLVETAYTAMIRLNSLKAEYGIISQEMAEAENQRLEAARDMRHTIDEIVVQSDKEALHNLKGEIDRINMSAHTHWEELKLPVGATPVRFLRSLLSWATGW
ncbi:MAG: TIGR04190 family B12-binding domain/radical SAM domain protein [Dehalococcoidales bacterium]|nr:MAG: TIGR04190 family B12-binding domain/radical SAM domain protein [Dehalococcoidales bacterium]